MVDSTACMFISVCVLVWQNHFKGLFSPTMHTFGFCKHTGLKLVLIVLGSLIFFLRGQEFF